MNQRNVKWLYLLTIVAVFAAALGTSAILGKDALKSCFWSIVVSGIAGCGGFAPILYATLYKPSFLIASVIAASTIRLLLTGAGVVIILVFVKNITLWFVIWLGLFYLIILVLEVYFIIRTIDEQSESKG